MAEQNERLLAKELREHPGDWTLRLELAESLAGRGEGDEAARLLSQAPFPPESEEEFARATRLGLNRYPEKLTTLLTSFLARNHGSGWGHHCYARLLAQSGDLNGAARHHSASLALDASFDDPELEALLDEQGIPWEAAPVESSDSAGAGEAPVTSPVENTWEGEPAAQEEVSVLEPEPAPEPRSAPEPVPEEIKQESAPVTRPAAASSGPSILALSHLGSEVESRRLVRMTRERISALIVAIVAHLALLLVVGLVVVIHQRASPPQIVALAAPVESDTLQNVSVRKQVRQSPVEPASAQMNVVGANAFSQIALPPVDVTNPTFDSVGVLGGIGTDMSFAVGKGSGTVSFFGARTKSKRVVFVVDFSTSMNMQGRAALTKNELIRSIETLPEGVEYQIICFGGPSWYAGQEVDYTSPRIENGYFANIVRDGNTRHVWYVGWDENNRFKEASSSTGTMFYHYENGRGLLPVGRYLKATPENLSLTIQQIKKTQLVHGTDWRWPIKMAINMKPDTIYFMTDGELSVDKTTSASAVIEDLLSYNKTRARARIHTVCMKELRARKELEAIAKGTGGTFTLVLPNGDWVRGDDLNKYDIEAGNN